MARRLRKFLLREPRPYALAPRPAEEGAREESSASPDLVLRLCGDLDLSDIDALERNLQRLSASRPHRVVLDISRLDGIPAVGIGALIRHLRPHADQLVVFAAGPEDAPQAAGSPRTEALRRSLLELID